MARINLLPWREELRQERQRQFLISTLATAVAGVVIVFLVTFGFDQRISHQEQRNQTLRNEIARLEQRIKRIEQLEQTRDRLLSRKRIIEELQASRSLTVELMDKLAHTIPVGVTLATVRQQGSSLNLEGTSQSNARVSAYLQELQDSDLIQDPQLRYVRTAQRAATPVEPYEWSIAARLKTREDDSQGDMEVGNAQ